MDFDTSSLLRIPPLKRRKVMEVRPSPLKPADLLATFGAHKSPTSKSTIAKEVRGHGLRHSAQSFNYAESSSTDTPTPSPVGSSFGDSPQSSRTSVKLLESSASEHELDRKTRPSRSTRELPARSTRSRQNYAPPSRNLEKNKKIPRKASKFTSDLLKPSRTKPVVQTERNKVRSDIAERTRPKRNAFLLANKDYFLPLLPETSYFDKLQRVQDMQEVEMLTVPYVHLTSQPSNVKAVMKPYQLEGLSFLVHMYENGVSAILGDEMGLGKTLQTLSLFSYLKQVHPTKGENRPFLVVCPLSVLSSWMNESKKWVPDLNVVRFHGPKIERDTLKDDCRNAQAAAKIDVIVTTYEMFTTEQNWFKRAFVWRYCVLDEGHKIKNDKSDVSQALQTLSAEYRLLLTGTPLQNNLSEMWSLLHWLYPEVFTPDTADNFKRAFDLTQGRVSTAFMDYARTLLELIMLRRMKNSPGVDLGLPPKEEILLYVPLTPMQRFWYTRLLTKADKVLLEDVFRGAKDKDHAARQLEAQEDQKQLGLLLKAENDLAKPAASTEDVWAESREIMQKALQNENIDTKTSDWRKLMNLIIQLRKVCSHPYILPNTTPEPYYLGDHIVTASGKFIVLDKLIEELVRKQRKKILIFAGWTHTLTLCEDLLLLRGGNTLTDAAFRYLRLDGSTSRARRNLGIRMFNQPDSEFKVMLISTRAGGLGINLASASDVVFMDEDWNPQITIQAEARAHRIGQTQKVSVYKLCTQGTVEEQMMGRIRKKLYLSAKITESMRNIHGTDQSKKRKRGSSSDAIDEEAPQLDTSSLKSLIRRGAETLARPEVDVTEMLGWSWETTLEKCKDKPIDTTIAGAAEPDEQAWLNSMEKVECAVFEGKKHQKAVDKAVAEAADLTRADRRIGKNTTVMVNGFAINKKSLNCGDWEAVPTLAGKDPRLAEPKREKRAAIVNQDFCQTCWDGGEVVLCSGCPRSYHIKCLDKAFQLKARAKTNFYCPQHECIDCEAKTANAGGLIYRCRWCQNGYCEDCLDWDTVKLVGVTLPEYEMLGYGAMDNAWYVECPACVAHWKVERQDLKNIEQERTRIQRNYREFLREGALMQEGGLVDDTSMTVTEVGTPADADEMEVASKAEKKMKVEVVELD